MAQQYRVFKRKAWIRDNNHYGSWKPYVGRKTTACYVGSIEEARRICKEHNDARTSRGQPFCEFES